MVWENYLERIQYYRNQTESYYRRLEEQIYEFDYKYDHENYFIEPDKDWYLGIISVDTTHNITEWFQKYHEPFIKNLELKLIRVTRKQSLGKSNYSRFKIEYTYKDNPRFPEVSVDEIKDYLDNYG